MKIIEKPMRRDGKVPVTFIFNNGVQIRKVLTPEQVAEHKAKQAARLTILTIPEAL